MNTRTWRGYSDFTDNEEIEINCETCKTSCKTLLISAKRNVKKNGIYICRSCLCKKNLKPQNKKGYWTKERRAKLGHSIKNSDKYYQSIQNRDISGTKNGMYGKKHKTSSILKMSRSRTGKFGSNATAWKGGKKSLICRIKGIIHRHYNWYFRVYQRDGFKCSKCFSKKKIDAHHIDPIAAIVKRLSDGKKFKTDDEKFIFLIMQPEIIDIDLKNGITLCRTCHKVIHSQWGSHNATAKK